MFINLHNHSYHSYLDSTIAPEKLPQKAKELGQEAVALTDHGALYGIYDFYKACKKAGVKPILGCEVYIVPDMRLKQKNGQYNHLVLLAKDDAGWANLIKIVSTGFTEGFYYKPRLDREYLRNSNLTSGIIALSACLAGEIPAAILAGSPTVEDTIRDYAQIFKDGFYLELQANPSPEQRKVNEALADLSLATGVPLVASSDSHYLTVGDRKNHSHFIEISRSSADDVEFYEGNWFKSEDEIREGLSYLGEAVISHALENTSRIASSCDVNIKFKQKLLPKYPIPGDKNAIDYLRGLCVAKLWGMNLSEEDFGRYMQRLEYELGVIDKTGFADYFLIVQDLCLAADREGVARGPGRGSGAASLVSYLLGITALDPLEHNLMFERFLNADRISYPDIDLDFHHEKRHKVIDYIVQRYGRENVGQILTTGRMLAKGAYKDSARVHGMAPKDADAITKMFPPDASTIQEAMEKSATLKAEINKHPEVLNLALAIEGLPRHISVHAGGVVIAPGPLVDYVQVTRVNDALCAAVDMETLEEIGLLKMDILGLRTVTILEKAKDLVQKTRGVTIDYNNLPLKDKDVFRLISEGDTTGVFQLESSGMRQLCKDMGPDRFSDLTALVALYRPGPLGSGMAAHYVKRKNGLEKVEVPVKRMEALLKDTYGVIVYQEDVMRMAVELAGYTASESDELRKAVAKKKPDLMKKHQAKFVEGMVQAGHPREVAENLWSQIDSFGAYGFNQAHAAAYAMISYQTAYMKTHYPAEFIAACMSVESEDTEKLGKYVTDARRHGIEVLPPDIDKSEQDFTVQDGKIRWGLCGIKNLGAKSEGVLKNRPFRDLPDYLERGEGTKSTALALISAGAFDNYGERKSLFLQLYNMKGGNVPQTETEIAKAEHEIIGFCLHHPMAGDKSLRVDGDNVETGGYVCSVRTYVDKKGQDMAFVMLETPQGPLEVVVFAGAYKEHRDALKEWNLIKVQGRMDGLKLISRWIELVRVSDCGTVPLPDPEPGARTRKSRTKSEPLQDANQLPLIQG